MLVDEQTVFTAIISIVGASAVSYYTFRLKLESRLKDLEHEVKLLEPIRNIVLKIGSEEVENVFRREGR